MTTFDPRLADLRSRLLPAERGTLHWGSHAYHWERMHRDGRLTLTPGHAPGDPTGCPATSVRKSDGILQGGLLGCVLHKGHATRHAHRPVLGGTITLWGTPPKPFRLPPQAETFTDLLRSHP